MPLKLMLNGAETLIPGLESPATMDRVVTALDLQPGRIAVEHNGAIAPRSCWADILIQANDRLEVVHFVGGGGD